MRNGVGYITLTDGKMHFLMRQTKADEPMLLSTPVQSPEEALEKARDHAFSNGAPLDRAILAIDGRECFLRNYQLPVKGKRQLEQVVGFELNDDLPIDLDELVTDTFRGGGPDGLSYVSVAGIKKQRIADLLEVFREADVSVEGLDVDVAAFARACLKHFSEYDSFAGFEIGNDRTLFCLVNRSKVRYLSVIPLGESHLIDAVCKAIGKPRGEVERLILMGKDGGDDDPFYATFEKHLEHFLRRLLREADRLVGGAEWPSLSIVSGHIVRAQCFRHVFRDVSGGDMEVWEDKGIPLGSEVDEGQRGSGLAVAYGAAERMGSSFNLLKGEFASADMGSAWKKDAAYLLVLACLILLAWGGYAYSKVVSAEREINSLNDAILQLYKDALPEVSQEMALQQYESILSSRVDMLTGGGEEDDDVGTPSVIEALRTISSAIHRNVDVEFVSLSMDGERIEIQGETATMGDVDAVRASLSGVEAFEQVKVKSAIADQRSKKIRFELEVQR